MDTIVQSRVRVHVKNDRRGKPNDRLPNIQSEQELPFKNEALTNGRLSWLSILSLSASLEELLNSPADSDIRKQ